MASEQDHIALANKNHDALRALLGSDGEHPEWVATIAFYKALQILEATFAFKGLGHGHGHQKRLEIIQDARNGYQSLRRHYEALQEASEIARYLGDEDGPQRRTLLRFLAVHVNGRRSRRLAEEATHECRDAREAVPRALVEIGPQEHQLPVLDHFTLF